MLAVCDECGKITYHDKKKLLNPSEPPVCEVCGHAVTMLQDQGKDPDSYNDILFDESRVPPFGFHPPFPSSKILKTCHFFPHVLSWMVQGVRYIHQRIYAKISLKRKFQLMLMISLSGMMALIFLQPAFLFDDTVFFTSPLFWILNVMMLIFGSIGWFCALRLAARLENLVNHIHHISLGELDKDLNMNSRDEFGRLLEAVRRMQASLIFAERRLHHESNDHRQAA